MPASTQQAAPQHGLNVLMPKRVTRIDWLDGVRGCAAFYVMLHHTYLLTFPGFPVNTGPWYLGVADVRPAGRGRLYRRFGVFAGARSCEEREQTSGRRIRIFASTGVAHLPYWVALALATAIGHYFLYEAPGHEVNLRGFLVNALLLQDIIANHPPKGAFWSIAIEAQIYLVFPAMLLMTRAYSSRIMALTALGMVCVTHLLAISFTQLVPIDRLIPQFWAGFAFGVMAADEVSSATPHFRGWPLTRIAGGLTVLLVAVCATLGLPRVVELSGFFLIDIAVAIITAIAFVGFAELPSRFARFLASRPLQFLGQFSYSLYLLHGVFLALIFTYWFWPRSTDPLVSYVVAASVVSGVSLVASYLFFLLFERPFLTIRSWSAFRFWVAQFFPPFRRSITKA